MPASGDKETMSANELLQRQEASKKHGAFSYRDRGEDALERPQRGRLGELKERVQSREGVMDLIEDNAVKAVMMVEIVTSYVAAQKMSGVPLEDIPVLAKLPAFLNSAQRALRDLISLIPDHEDAIDAASILEEVRRSKDEKQDTRDE